MNVILLKALEIGVGLLLNILEIGFLQLIDNLLDNTIRKLYVSFLIGMTCLEFIFFVNLYYVSLQLM